MDADSARPASQPQLRQSLSPSKKNPFTPPSNLYQELQLEQYRLEYLKKCKYLKRPPQSLRITGANALSNNNRIQLISQFETTILNRAIKDKVEVIDKLKNDLDNINNIHLTPMSSKQKKKYTKHFHNKFEFQKTQDDQKWSDWPSKQKVDVYAGYRNAKTARKVKRKMISEASKIIKQGIVRNLTDLDIPPESIVVLGKGLGFVPTPSADIEELRLDIRHTINQINSSTISNQNNQTVNTSSDHQEKDPMRKLRIPNYHATDPPNNRHLKQTSEHLSTKVNTVECLKGGKVRNNLSQVELNGLDWLKSKTAKGEISITKADKGGAILIVKPNILEEAIKEKLDDVQLYRKLENDPRAGTYARLYEHWLNGKSNKHVTAREAKLVMGITEHNNKSTSSIYKYGISYFSPSLKIHKLKPEEIVPGCQIPARLILAAQDGVTKRSDVFIQQKWLNDLQNDFCKDLVSDTNNTLEWLDMMNNTLPKDVKSTIHPFTFDFKSLYDSLSPNLIREALITSMAENRPEWSIDFQNWLVDLIEISLDSSFGYYKENWYKSITGIATGNSISVQIANIAVYYVLRTIIYQKDLTQLIPTGGIKRFIDDGVGLFVGTEVEFIQFSKHVSQQLLKYDLIIEPGEWKFAKNNKDPVNFLDIKFWFDNEGDLQTDLYIKPTDARAYLNFTSCHPVHIFPGIIYTQALRLRRIINNQERLLTKMNELKMDFKKAKYPANMITNITNKVISFPRPIGRNKTISSNHNTELTDSFHEKTKDGNGKLKVKIITTHGRDSVLKNLLKDIPNKDFYSFKHIKRTAPSLNNILCKSKTPSLGPKNGISSKCNHPTCQCCGLMTNTESTSIKVNNKNIRIRTGKGNCQTRNVIYLVKCNCCNKHYIGKTTQPLHARINQHRWCFTNYVKKQGKVKLNNDKDAEKYALGIHLFEDHKLDQNFNDAFKVYILEVTQPRIMDIREHMWIHRLKSITPGGLNLGSTYGLPLLS